ncbi:MAG: sigma-54 dependent transcriptional regulator [Deltaproteobacteria bacterium]|jgi:DNA-binding NtrC family response regulator|nr:sigma-54 dependent transcriptional regulator [Deltaproteobacteria bacterium]
MRIMVVDDNESSLHSLCLVLRDLGHETTAMLDSQEALKEASASYYPLIISDIRMPGLNGLELLQELKSRDKTFKSDVLLITGFADMETAVQALRGGAYDYLNKPIDAAELAAVVERCAEHQKLLDENINLKEELGKAEEATRELRDNLVAVREQLREVYSVGEVLAESSHMRALIDEAMIFHAHPDVPVLIEGETGTGKEIFARIIHYGLSTDAGKNIDTPFVALNCSAIPRELFGSELFGYEQGAFTGSRSEGSPGKLELAGNGTLFLDEIAEMPYDMQPNLLRVLEDRSFYRLGGKHERKFKARIVCACNRPLAKMVQEGQFRRDLFHRLTVGHLSLPPLRKRTEEIFPLAMFFLQRETKLKKKHFISIHPDALKLLLAYPWLGNVRELKNAVERAVLLNDDTQLKPEHLGFLLQDRLGIMADNVPSQIYGSQTKHNASAQIAADGDTFGLNVPSSLDANQYGQELDQPSDSSDDIYLKPNSLNPESFELPDAPFDLESFCDAVIRKTMDKFEGNKSKAAEYLNMSRFALHRRVKK